MKKTKLDIFREMVSNFDDYFIVNMNSPDTFLLRYSLLTMDKNVEKFEMFEFDDDRYYFFLSYKIMPSRLKKSKYKFKNNIISLP